MRFLLLILILVLSSNVFAQSNAIEELDPFDPSIEEKLLELDLRYEEATGKSAFLPIEKLLDSCYGRSCPVFIDVNKDSQTAMLFVDGTLVNQWPVSTGVDGHLTPDFDRHPNGRIYDAYSSQTYPGGGDYHGLGNMPYAVFISGGFAIHGTPEGNWPHLGHRASHGCIRLHPDNAHKFNRLVRSVGVTGTWITVK